MTTELAASQPPLWLRTLLDTSTEAIALIDRDGRVLLGNSACISAIGDFAVGGGRSLWDLYPHLIGQRFWSSFRETLATRGIVVETEFLERTQHWVTYTMRPVVEGPGEVTQIAVAWRNVSGERLLRSALADARAELDQVLSVGRVIEWSLDLEDQRVTFSKNALPYFGRSTIAMAEFAAQIDPAQQAAFNAAILKAIERASEQVELDFSIRAADGQTLLLRSRQQFVPGRLVRADRVEGVMVVIGEAAEGLRRRETGGRGLSGRQLRAARAMLGWSVRELAERSGVSVSTIVRAEDDSSPATSRRANLDALRRSLNEAGVRLFLDEQGRPAVSSGEAQIMRMAGRGAEGTETPESPGAL